MRKPKIPTTGSEAEEQAAVIVWSQLYQREYPELEYLFAVPNGGLRNKVVAAQLVGQGVKPGVPDLHLPVRRTAPYNDVVWSGLWIEMKIPGGRTEPDQSRWHEFLRGQGYYVSVCYGWQEAARTLSHYLKGEL